MFLDAEQTNAQNAALLGKMPDNTPKQTHSLFVDYRPDFLPGCGLNAGAYYISKRFINNLEQGIDPGLHDLHGWCALLHRAPGRQADHLPALRRERRRQARLERRRRRLPRGRAAAHRQDVDEDGFLAKRERERGPSREVGKARVLKYALHRIALAVPTLLIVAVIVFVLMRAIPGDPAQLMLGDLENPQALAQLRRDMGLDKPIAVQFLVWLKRLAWWATSAARSRSSARCWRCSRAGFGVTASLVVPAVVIASLLAIPLGMIAAWKQNTVWDVAVVTGAIVFLSIPSFWLGLIFLLVFGLKLDLLPVVGYVSPLREFPRGAALPHHAGDRARADRDRRADPHGALEHDRGAAAGIHHARARQGAGGIHRRASPRAQERDGADVDHDRPRAWARSSAAPW
jgi:hypothetical protein